MSFMEITHTERITTIVIMLVILIGVFIIDKVNRKKNKKNF